MLHTFTVFGIPAPKGSKSAFPIRKGKARRFTGRVAITERSSAKQREWTARVREVVQAHAAGGAEQLDGPLALTVRFYLPRPKSAPKRRRTWPDRQPDFDKLTRLVLDAMTGALIVDDARIVQAYVEKDYAEYSGDPRPRAVVSVWQIPTEEVRQGEASVGSGSRTLVAPGLAEDVALD